MTRSIISPELARHISEVADPGGFYANALRILHGKLRLLDYEEQFDVFERERVRRECQGQQQTALALLYGGDERE